jgi:hypothetical protein
MCGKWVIRQARRFNINARDLASRAEVMPPHPQAAAAINADLDHVGVASDELGEVSAIDLEIMRPFPDAGPFPMRFEVLPERVLHAGVSPIRSRIPRRARCGRGELIGELYGLPVFERPQAGSESPQRILQAVPDGPSEALDSHENGPIE